MNYLWGNYETELSADAYTPQENPVETSDRDTIILKYPTDVAGFGPVV